MNRSKKGTEQIEKVISALLFFYLLYLDLLQFLYIKNTPRNRIQQLFLLRFLLNLKTKKLCHRFFYFKFQLRMLNCNLFNLNKSNSYNVVIIPMEVDVFRTSFKIFGRNLIRRFPFRDIIWIYGHYNRINKDKRQKDIVLDRLRVDRLLFFLLFFNVIRHCG